MRQFLNVLGLVFCVSCLTTSASAQETSSQAFEAAEVARTWSGGLIFYPQGGRFAYGTIREKLDDARRTLHRRRLPVIVYDHGCSGIDTLSKQTAREYVLKGFLVVMPNSYARINKPPSCDPKTAEGGFHRDVLGWRQAETANAIRQARALPFADPRNVFLVGLSEGALTTATFTGEPVNARVIEGWGCHAGYPEYYGLNAPESEPVLSLTSEDDPWFSLPFLKGNCGQFMSKRNGSRAVIFGSDSVLRDQHFVFWNKDVQKTVFAFIRSHMK